MTTKLRVAPTEGKGPYMLLSSRTPAEQHQEFQTEQHGTTVAKRCESTVPDRSRCEFADQGSGHFAVCKALTSEICIYMNFLHGFGRMPVLVPRMHSPPPFHCSLHYIHILSYTKTIASLMNISYKELYCFIIYYFIIVEKIQNIELLPI